MSKLPFQITRDAIFRQHDSVYFDPRAPRRRPMRSEENPFLTRLDSSPKEPAITPAENVLIAGILILLALTWYCSWLIGG